MTDDLVAFAEAHAETLALMSEALYLLARDAPAVLLEAEPMLRVHHRVGARLAASIEGGVASLAEFSHFLEGHPELHDAA